MPTPPPHHLLGVQYLRGLGAVICAGVHAISYLHVPLKITAFGVEIFFVISGFVAALVVTRLSSKLSLMDRVRLVLVGTVVRLLPLYWLSLVIACWPWVMAWVSSAENLRELYWNLNPRLLGFLLDFLMIPRANPDFGGAWWPQNLLGWTLNLQLWLSCVFALAMLGGRYHLRLVAGIIGGTVLGVGFWPAAPVWASFYGQPASLAFLAGLGLFECYRHRPPSPLAVPSFLVATSGAALLFYLAGRSGSSLALTGASTLGVWLFLRVPAAEVRWARFLGDASYPVYLFHGVIAFPLVLQGARWWMDLDVARLAAGPLWLVLTLVVCQLLMAIAVGSLVHLVLERPLLSWMRSRWRRGRANAVSVDALRADTRDQAVATRA
jgi:peptidoglycan/LPS O-acetylase OafA/YrhL